jgi:hypothetical protein
VISALPAVTTLVCFVSHSHARLRVHWAPGIPHALCFPGRKIHAHLGRIAPRECGFVFRRQLRAERSNLSFVIPGWSEGPGPEYRDSGFDASHRPGMTASGFASLRWQRPRHDDGTTPGHSSRALLNANDDTRRVFSSRIKVRVIGGSARWLQFSRSQSRQLTPIGVPSVFSRSIPLA